jgi:hypothetical protein
MQFISLFLEVYSSLILVLGGLVGSVLAIGLQVYGHPAEGDGFLRAIKIRSTASFGGEVKPSALCHNILRHVKDPFKV